MKQSYYQELYGILQPEFRKLPNYHIEFDRAWHRALNLPTDSIEMQIRAILTASLKAYANTSPTTKGGRIGRFFARIGAIILPYLKFRR